MSKLTRIFGDFLPHGIARRLLVCRIARHDARRWASFYQGFVPRGGLVFDIGANRGHRVDAFLAGGFRVVAVEPQASCLHGLQSKSKNGTLEVVHAGCGSCNGEGALQSNGSADVFASLSPTFIQNAKITGKYEDRSWSRTDRVRIVTLDSLFQQHGKPDFIKIDVEGSEEEVLKGLSEPVAALSFEWSCDLPGAALACVKRCVDLNMEKFNFSFQESMRFGSENSLS